MQGLRPAGAINGESYVVGVPLNIREI